MREWAALHMCGITETDLNHVLIFKLHKAICGIPIRKKYLFLCGAIELINALKRS